MQLDTLDYKIINEALYHLATNPDLAIDDKAIADLSDEDLENRLLCLRQKIGRELNRRHFDDL